MVTQLEMRGTSGVAGKISDPAIDISAEVFDLWGGNNL